MLHLFEQAWYDYCIYKLFNCYASAASDFLCTLQNLRLKISFDPHFVSLGCEQEELSPQGILLGGDLSVSRYLCSVSSFCSLARVQRG